MYMEIVFAILLGLLLIFVIGYWWRTRFIACPASLSWLVENPYIGAVAGAEKILRRLELEPGMKVLDVGCGPGRISIPAALAVGEEGEVVALDLQPKMLEMLRGRADALQIKNIRLINAPAGSGGLQEHYFDRALLVTVLGEIPDKAAALTEIYSALKPGGILSVTELIPDPHYTSRSTLRRLCHEAGFIEKACFGNWFVFSINFAKPENL